MWSNNCTTLFQSITRSTIQKGYGKWYPQFRWTVGGTLQDFVMMDTFPKNEGRLFTSLKLEGFESYINGSQIPHTLQRRFLACSKITCHTILFQYLRIEILFGNISAWSSSFNAKKMSPSRLLRNLNAKNCHNYFIFSSGRILVKIPREKQHTVLNAINLDCFRILTSAPQIFEFLMFMFITWAGLWITTTLASTNLSLKCMV